MSEFRKISDDLQIEYENTHQKYVDLLANLQKSCVHEKTIWLRFYDKHGHPAAPTQTFHKLCTNCGKFLAEHTGSPETIAKIDSLHVEIDAVIEAAIKEDSQIKP